MTDLDLNAIAEMAMNRMMDAGFDAAQVSVGISIQDELNIAHNEASLLRSTEDYGVSLYGIRDARKASAAMTDISEDNIDREVQALYERALDAPQDDANAVSDNEIQEFSQGPLAADADLLKGKVKELLAFRQAETPLMNIEEGGTLHVASHDVTMTSGGSRLTSNVGDYSLFAMGTASEGDRSSSFNYTGGSANDLFGHASELFGMGDMLRETEQQIHTKPVGRKFEGVVILSPTAVGDLLYWLLGQLSDGALISDASVYRDKVGDVIASECLSIHSYFDAPGHAPFSSDAFVAPAISVVDTGRLNMLLPSLYGSRKTGVPHIPTSSGWRIDHGDIPKADLVSSVSRGALVNRLSMGSPGANGDFSGVVKNSFMIENGEQTHALSDSMIAGNMAQILRSIDGISVEHLDFGGEDFPWIRIPGLNFS